MPGTFNSFIHRFFTMQHLLEERNFGMISSYVVQSSNEKSSSHLVTHPHPMRWDHLETWGRKRENQVLRQSHLIWVKMGQSMRWQLLIRWSHHVRRYLPKYFSCLNLGFFPDFQWDDANCNLWRNSWKNSVHVTRFKIYFIVFRDNWIFQLSDLFLVPFFY